MPVHVSIHVSFKYNLFHLSGRFEKIGSMALFSQQKCAVTNQLQFLVMDMYATEREKDL